LTSSVFFYNIALNKIKKRMGKNTINFEDGIDMETPIEIMDDQSMQNAENPTPTPNEDENKEKEEEQKDLIEVNVDDNETYHQEEQEEIVPSENESHSSSTNTLSVLAKALMEEGIISNFNEEEAEDFDAKALMELVKGEIISNINEYKESLPSEVKSIINNYEEGVPLNKLIGLKSEQLQYNKLTEEQVIDNVELQKKLVRESLEEKGYSESKINRRIKQFESLDELEDESIDALTELKEISKQKEERLIAEEKQRRIANQQQAEQRMNELRENVFSTDFIIPGIELKEKDQKKIYKSMTEVVGQDESGNVLNAVMQTRAKNPLAFEKAVHYYHSIGLFDIDKKGNFKPDFSKVKRVSKNSAIDELTRVASSNRSLSSGKPARETYNEDRMSASIKALKDLMKKTNG